MSSRSDVALSVDIFCRVIDNFGDVGVCWRLARRLAHDRGWRVQLRIDALQAFCRLEPTCEATRDAQVVQGITIVKWDAPLLAPPADVVIEAFACDPPAAYLAAMRARSSAPVWINLEYLSAEGWVDDFHARSSLRADGLRKTFFFPGFTQKTGGLLREPDLFVQRDAVQASQAARAAALQSIGLQAVAERAHVPGHRLVTLFCYPTAPVTMLVAALRRHAARTHSPVTLCIPETVLPGWDGTEQTPTPMDRSLAPARQADVTIVRTPFLRQPDYDTLLWCADLNIVRGEDSFVRAIWAQRPMLWHIYPQADGLHLTKLDAWLERAVLPESAAHANRLWNRAEGAPPGALDDCLGERDWRAWEAAVRRNARQWGGMSDLADNLAEFCQAGRDSG